ncbi:MAG: NAD(P)H-hydrate dehydratase [Casimicrobiaceae bacterium]
MQLDPTAATLALILRAADIRGVEAEAVSSGVSLMERAGLAAAEVARTLADGAGSVLVLAGPGNNGGDAFVVARHLRAWFFDVTVVFAGDRTRLPADAAAAYAAFLDAGGTPCADLPRQWRGTLIVDGLFGIGLTRPIDAPYAGWIAWANASGIPVLALDLPSGLDADRGHAIGPAITARATSTFIALKPGLVTGAGIDRSGTLYVHDLGLGPVVRARGPGHWLTWPALAHDLPGPLQRRQKNVHKGTFGTLGIIGGGEGMIGAPLLAGRAALRTGAGRVRVGYAARTHPAADFGALELMVNTAKAVLDAGADVLVVGPGLGATAATAALLRRALEADVPLVLDADALNLVAKDAGLRRTLTDRHGATLLTPHPAEAARLCGTDTKSIQADRLGACLELAHTLGAHVVLKGAGSIVASPEGSWAINASGNPGLSAAGSGDVLAGMAGALLAQGLAPHDALRYAVCLHGAAADALVGRGRGPVGLVASELGDAARALVNDAAREN